MQVFQKEVKQLYQQISNQRWNQLNRIQRNLERFLPALERLSQDYEQFARNYPASSTDKRPFGKTESRSIAISILFTYEQRSEAALMLGGIAQHIMENIEQFILQHKQNSEYLAHLLKPILKTVCLWLKCIIDSRINDRQAIDDRQGEGMPVGETITSINLGQRISLQAPFNEPRCSETIMNHVFYRALSWLASGEIFYLRHQTAERQPKPEYLTTYQQLLAQLLQQYRDHRPFRNYEPQPDAENFIEIHLNYAEQLIFCVHSQRWDLVQMTLQQLASMLPPSDASQPQESPEPRAPIQRKKTRKKSDMEKLIDKVSQVIDPKKWHQECVNRRLFALYEYLSMTLRAGHQSFNYFYQQHVSASTPQQYSLNIETLRSLLTQFKQWAERMITYGLVTTSEQTVELLYLHAKEQLEENTRQLEQLHQSKLKFLAEYFQKKVVPPKKKTKDRKTRDAHQKDGAGSPIEEDSPGAAQAAATPVMVQTNSETTDGMAVVEHIERGETSSDEDNEWQQVKTSRRRIPVETALNNLSEALRCQNTNNAITSLRSTNLNDAYQQLQNPSQEQETLPIDVLTPLISGYLQVWEMSHNIKRCESWIPDIRPFIVSLLDEDILAPREITNQFINAIKEFNTADISAQRALGNISDHINTLLDLQTESETSSNITAMAALEVLITSTQSLKERLTRLREGTINAWKKRYELLLRHYPQKLKAKKTTDTDQPLKTMMTNNAAFRKCSSDFEKHQNTHQRRQAIILQTEQPSDSSRPSQAQVAVSMDISNRLKVS
ncbi:hypothetical protein GCM10023116_28750 [Kistimonas scapharcae]|uniref:Uncharacterized protein n=1 Tax=Kistimonas scapharcae TaxID=1036133 RepID=A0ABP8V3X2_9GAMM